MGRRPTTAQKLELANKRRKLKTRIVSFTKLAIHYLGEDIVDGIYEIEQIILDEDVSDDEVADSENLPITSAVAEHQVLPFPSTVPDELFLLVPVESQSVITELRQTELRLRQGHGDDALDQVRSAVINLSWQYKNRVRTATSGVQKTRAWDKIKLLNLIWKLQRRVYNQNRLVMMKIGNRTAVAQQNPFLDLQDCNVSTTMTNPNSAGQSSDRLPWFWSSSSHAAGGTATDTEHQTECKFPCPPLTN